MFWRLSFPMALLIAAGPYLCSDTPQPGEVLKLELPSTPGAPLHVSHKAPDGTQWVVLFYRKEGETEFETLSLDQGPDGIYSGIIETPFPPGIRIQYYSGARAPAGLSYLPAGAPKNVFTLQLPGTPVPETPKQAPSATATPAAAPKPPAHGPIYVDGNLTDLVHRQNEVPGEATLQAAGQIRVALHGEDATSQWLVNGRLVYTDQPLPGQTRWSLGDFQAAYRKGGNRLQVGDISTQESEFTLGGMGRRGFDYAYTGSALAGQVFALNTERQAGTRGLFWPVEGSEVYGGSLGYAWPSLGLKAKVVFLLGRDDPSTAVNVATPLPPPVREGSTGALVLDGRWLNNRLAVSGEYARSVFTADISSGQAKDSDQAWRFSGQWTEGAFSAHAGYHDIGRDFGTVGIAYFVGDRRISDASAGFNYATWGISTSFSDERLNPTGQANLPQAWNQSQSLDARFLLGSGFTWRLGLKTARQEAGVASSPIIPFSDSERFGVSTGLDYTLPPKATLSFNAQFDRLHGLGGSSIVGKATSISLGGSLTFGSWLRLTPNLSWSQTSSEPDDQRSTVNNVFLNAEFTLVQKSLTFLLNGGQSRTELPSGQSMDTSTAEGTLNFTLDPYLHGFAHACLGLKGRYVRNPALLGFVSDNRVFIVLNLSF